MPAGETRNNLQARANHSIGALGYKKRVEIVGRVMLKKDRDSPVRGGNPWTFSQAIARAEPAGLSPGDGVEVFNVAGDRLGLGYFARL